MGPGGTRGEGRGVRVAFSGKGMEQGLRFNNSTYLHDLARSEPIPKMCALALWICCSCEIIRNNKWQTHPAWILAWFLFPTYPCPLGRTVTFCRYLDFFLSACFCHRYFLRVRGGRFCVWIRMEYNPVQNTISRYFFRRLCHCTLMICIKLDAMIHALPSYCEFHIMTLVGAVKLNCTTWLSILYVTPVGAGSQHLILSHPYIITWFIIVYVQNVFHK